MSALEQSADAGFTGFTLLANNRTLAVLRDSPRYNALFSRRDQIVHHAAELAIADLRGKLGEKYLYDADEPHKLIFAVAVDQPTLTVLESDLQVVEAVEEKELFSHPPDEFIRIVVPSEADFSRMAPAPHLGGDYDDTTRTAVSMRLGQFMTHEFTHALHAADQHALGQEHPVWLSEGLASLYESCEIDGNQLIAHDNSRLKFVRFAAKSGGLLPLDKLLRMTRQDFNSRPNLAYGQASCLLRYLQEAGLLKRFYDVYTAGYGKDPTGAAALAEATGSKLPAIQMALSEWILERPEPPTPARPAGPCWAWASLMRLMGFESPMFLPAVPRCPRTSRSGMCWWQWTEKSCATARLWSDCLRHMNPGNKCHCGFAGGRSTWRRRSCWERGQESNERRSAKGKPRPRGWRDRGICDVGVFSSRFTFHVSPCSCHVPITNHQSPESPQDEEHCEHGEPDAVEKVPVEAGVADGVEVFVIVSAGAGADVDDEKGDDAADDVEGVEEDEKEDEAVEHDTVGLRVGVAREQLPEEEGLQHDKDNGNRERDQQPSAELIEPFAADVANGKVHREAAGDDEDAAEKQSPGNLNGSQRGAFAAACPDQDVAEQAHEEEHSQREEDEDHGDRAGTGGQCRWRMGWRRIPQRR